MPFLIAASAEGAPPLVTQRAEIGVIFLLFAIGLELSGAQQERMGPLMFGGGAQAAVEQGQDRLAYGGGVCLGRDLAGRRRGRDGPGRAAFSGRGASPHRSRATRCVEPFQVVFAAVFFSCIGMLPDLQFLMDDVGSVAVLVVVILALKVVTTGAAARVFGQRGPVRSHSRGADPRHHAGSS